MTNLKDTIIDRFGSVAKCAKELKISRQHLNDICNGLKPGPTLAMDMAKRLNINRGDLRPDLWSIDEHHCQSDSNSPGQNEVEF